MNKPNKFSPEVHERAVTTVMALGLRTTSSASCDECPNRPFLTHFSLSLLAPDRLLCSESRRLSSAGHSNSCTREFMPS